MVEIKLRATASSGHKEIHSNDKSRTTIGPNANFCFFLKLLLAANPEPQHDPIKWTAL